MNDKGEAIPPENLSEEKYKMKKLTAQTYRGITAVAGFALVATGFVLLVPGKALDKAGNAITDNGKEYLEKVKLETDVEKTMVEITVPPQEKAKDDKAKKEGKPVIDPKNGEPAAT